MSRAFTQDDDERPEAPPERAISDQPNYMTQRGHEAMHRQLEELRRRRETLKSSEALEGESDLALVERDIRYFTTRLASAIVVPPQTGTPERVAFGTRVHFEDEQGNAHCYRIVGEDEALASAEEQPEHTTRPLSWASPLARALMGASVGDTVVWPRPSGNITIEVTAIEA
ncbi:transcription elongation factor [Litchfieldella qijiaojingensis]|uniref:Transcription elongation factor n=1 Tax=Litchfieldella qijiaojingensis TaxID=980347 RepID=A0ABQ2YRY1_9GAMM|nr:GreA/GreB family elongation factor [Halomonas qijiaojingensis]GGX93372.1 transcription elongation factor [Halomonas qijiaojingensis]